ncbi:oligosaccharyl transferase, archaeosortase A system-associated [Methanosphaerula palustris]|uniref:dolichyl-phosphooligosaccharide-protein glycotransferase n=1 Tax=Methanosphaerula palustris (strain ATCC BAA-1556 / DSM 19958 / E1-9c) TaxID=521011 RepID=B8GG73_METPE|nr:oligosaccharyl transferase, archaeosortase A system-associated [Methanosphaerula palustris]ACL16147.1 Oligosaccharyl transferase STT3 subunit [Methanosphaerula palustris E1-9c]
MTHVDLKDYRTYLIPLLVAVFTAFALWIRILPALHMGSSDILNFVGSDDPIYNVRLAELMVNNFPNYPWFDPMTYFPQGTHIFWGPLFTTIIASLCMLTGAHTSSAIIFVALLVPPLMAAAMVPITYKIGAVLGNWKTGLFAAAFISVVSGQYFYRSLFGYSDHHIGEVLFSTIFCLAYIYVVRYTRTHTVDLADRSTLMMPALLSVAAGIAYFLGLLLMPTMILFAMLVGIFTIVQFMIDVYRKHETFSLLLINTITFGVAIICFLIFGVKSSGFGFAAYTLGHPIAYLLLIAMTAVLYLLAQRLHLKEVYYYPLVLAGIAIVGGLILFLVMPQVYGALMDNLLGFFGQNYMSTTIQEARGWSVEAAWSTFHFGLLLMFLGFGVLFYRCWNEHRPEHLFVLIWSVVILFATMQHIRYEYYLAANIAIVGGLAASTFLERGWKDISLLLGINGKKAEKPALVADVAGESPKKQKKAPVKAKHVPTASRVNTVNLGIFVAIIIVSLLFAYCSLFAVDLNKDGSSDFVPAYSTANSNVFSMNGDWREALEWMKAETPDTGMDMKKIYNAENFTYPQQAYGVMSWWDYGHMITYIAQRMPNANPFQEGVDGPTGAAAYFMATNESDADKILDTLKTRFVVTDIEMDVSKFWAMSTWYNSTAASTPYQPTMLTTTSSSSSSYQTVTINNQLYYMTMIARLHTFDGSMTDPTTAYYIEYKDAAAAKTNYPVITKAESQNATEAQKNADAYNLKPAAGMHAMVGNPNNFLPVGQVPALQHYRLVHESSTNGAQSLMGTQTGVPDIKYVKVFEYVKGAHIKGDGVIEVPVVTNTGRTYTYRQQSVNGEFIVPYATSGNPYEVKTTGSYHIVGSDKSYDVTESDIQTGATVA